MINKSVKQSPVFSEFSSNDQNYHFDLKKERVMAHVDTLYYSCFVYGDSNACDENMQALLDQLKALKSQKSAAYDAYVEFFGLSVENVRFSNYEYCLRLEENFDIFISSYLPNDFTPRIIVQLRTRTLILDGTCQAICKSFRKVEDILSAFGLEVDQVQENRIDYAYHTNLIQNPYNFLNDNMLIEKMKTNIRLYTKVGNVGKIMDIDYLALGSRRSNDVFIRIYNKSREVVEKNYKAFFFDKWLQDGLINRYDYYVYQKAYKYGSYLIGLLIGRIDWYLEYGKNTDIKDKLLKVKSSCYVKSDNTEQLKKIVDEFLPPVTLIVNIEFQTKRKFYSSLDEWMSCYAVAILKYGKLQGFLDDKDLPLFRLHRIISLRSEICNYLTSKTLSFVENKGTDEERFCYFWQRINQCYIEEYEQRILDLFRSHERATDMEKSKHRVCGTVAQLSILKSGNFEKSNFKEDISDVLCTLNDNDFYGFAADPETGTVPEFNVKDYDVIKKRKQRQYYGIFEKLDKEKKKEKKEKKEKR